MKIKNLEVTNVRGAGGDLLSHKAAPNKVGQASFLVHLKQKNEIINWQNEKKGFRVW